MKMHYAILSLALVSAAVVTTGCAGRASLIPNKDQALRKTSTQFAADAAKRSYKADAPQGGEAPARAEVDYTLKELRIGNLSPDDWNDVEIWVNQKYVVFLPALPRQNKGEGYRHLNFQMFYDNQGEYFPVNFIRSKQRIEKVEVYRDGKIFAVPVALAD